ncbi:lipocalin-like domain-containing protein [Streptomyces fumanus]|uniref:Lipocalin-like domain-containing protein n=1 Tax=Streptomyces fumanus TaxID=67302 RepID=A0A919DYW8_9ACTN|nr:lipocalin-like domain-containing protein [Streptomyces fumanus]GHE92124.1 hypothetical protein GCM10018772_14730 [Streptomyces fumanus]
MDPLTHDALTGIWQLTGMDAGWRHHPIRVSARGTLIYLPHGHVCVVLQISPSARFRVRKTISYIGRFRVDGDHVVHHVTSGTWPVRNGKELRRRAELTGEHLRLTPARTPGGVSCTLLWQRTTTTTNPKTELHL